MKQRKKNVSGRRKQRILSGILAVLLIVALAVGLMPNDQVYAAEKTSDGNTTGSYAQNLGNNSSTRYAGRVWTDKTVYTEDATFSGDVGNVTVQNDSDFLVAYSALATTQNITGKSSVPVDVVFVIDNSNSMDDSVGGGSGQSRLAATVEAVNTSIATIMESHPDSRVAVVLYGSSAHTLMPLGHYSASTSWQHNGDYIWYESDTYYSGYYGGYVTDTTFESVANNQKLEMKYGERGTNIHSGVDTGMDILKNASNIGEGSSKYVPALVLLSDGAATYAGSGNWWDPSGSQGIGSEPSVTFSMETAMHAQYQKQLVNNHYGVDADADTSCKIYTIGMGIEQISGSERNIARLALNPGTYITENNNEANAMENAWNSYLRGQNPTMRYPADTDYWGYTEYSDYTFRHPNSGDISTIAYNDGYYSAENAEDVTNVFDDITSEIVSASAQAPTQIEGGDPLKSGYLTYTDPIGEYMEVKDIKSIIYGGKQFTQKSSSTSGNTTTYTFTGDKIESPVYGELDVSLIEVSVTKGDDGNETLTVKIPAAAIPLRVNTVDIDEHGAITNTNNNAYPARILYTVGAREGVDLDTLEGVSDDYISANMTEDGQYVNFYSNMYSGNTKDSKTVGDATVTLTPAETNPFFYVQENTPLYTAANTNSPAERVQNDDTLYYFQITYYEGNEGKTEWVSRPGSSFWHNGSTDATITTLDSGQVAIKQGAPRLGYLTDFAQTKGENTTNTAEQVFHPVYDGNGQFTVYLGNNGVLKANAPKSLTVEKDVAAGEGLTAPDADFTFEVTVATKAETTGDAILTDADGQKTDKELTFDADGKTTFTLKDGQSMEILNIGESVEYTVKEINLPAGFTSDQTDNTKTGTVSATDADNVVTFTNTYNVTEVTTEDLGITLGGTKSITGRDFQTDDEFVFTIAPAQATPDAPLPTEDTDQDGSATTATVNPTSGDEVAFEFGDVTFDKPGEYRYVIRETTGNLQGVDYDGALYRVNIIVKDNGDGTLSLASVDGGLTGAGNVSYPTNPFIQVWDGDQAGAVVSAVAFENHYSATSAEATIQGMKVLNSTNSDRILADGDFTFTIEALGYNTDGGEQFNQIPAGDPEQPMPANTEVNNVANGNVIFGEMTFTQDMIGNTYGYKITEKLPQGVNENNPTLNGVTYDTSEKIVKVTVTRSNEGGEEHVVATVTPNDGTAEAAKNFTFTNKYEPSSITIGEDTDNAITVQKTFTGRTWNDSDTFEYTLKALDGAPAPAQTTLSIDKPASGTSNTAIFGDITFEKEGVYEYEITETKGNLGGVAYDEHTATVTVTVTEDTATGTLSAKVEYDNIKAENDSDKAVQNAAAFTNTYKAVFDADTTVNLNGTKELTGKKLTDSAFYFIVDPQETASGGHAPTGESVAWNPNKADGSIQLLKNVTYTEAGEYVYIIREQIPSNKALGMTYDESEYRVTVTVTDDQQGNLTASTPKIEKKAAGAADYTDATAVEFENSYEPLSGTYAPREITKVLDGDRNTPLQEGEFSFEMSVVSANPEDGITLPQETTVANDANGKVKFGDITFTKVGKYVVQVKEIVPADEADKVDGVTYSTNVIKTTFDVRDEDGQLKAYVTGTDGSLTFTNDYNTTGNLPGETALKVTKNLTGREWQTDDTFTFTLAAANEATEQAVTDGYVALPDNAKGITIAYDEAQPDAEKTESFGDITITKAGDYVFVISESVPSDEDKIGGISYDGSSKYVVVNAADNGNGTLTITSKVMDGIGEDAKETTLTFTNTYEPGQTTLPGSDNLKVTKTFTDRPNNEWLDTDSFEFTLAADMTDADTAAAVNNEEIVLPESTTLTVTKDNNTSAAFGDIIFKKAGTYKFTVTETQGAIPGVTYDTTPRTVIVNVVDNKDGTMTASLDENSQALEFTNTYDNGGASLAGDTALKATKSFTGRPDDEWLDSDQFVFELSVDPADEATAEAVKSGAVVLPNDTTATATKDQRTASFGEIKFTEEGTYQFVVSERNDGINGVTYDTTTKHVTVEVTDNDDGTMSTKVTIDGTETSEMTFTNTYDTTSTTIVGATDLQVKKVLTGREWQEGDTFTFTLSGEEGKAGYTLPKNADGITIAYDAENPDAEKTASFGDITFTEPGDYTFVVKEFTPADEDKIGGVTYDQTEYTVAVKVEDQNDGTLKAEVTGITKADGTTADDLTFTNIYNPGGASLADDTALQVTKKVAGAATEEDFNFNLKLTSDNAANVLVGGTEGTAITDKGITVSTGEDGFTDGQEKTVSFGALTFTAAGDYIFTVSEVEADGNVPDGWTYDDSDKTITVHVTDEGFDGQLDIAADGGVEGNNPTFYNTYYKPEDAKSAEDADGNDISGDMLGVGDELTYTIDWVNNATDENGAPVKATVVVTDTIPAGTELVEDSISNGGELAGGTITWTFEDQEPAASGTVSFKVRVTEEAAGTTIKNDAEIQIGDNDPKTSTVVNPVPGKQETTDPDKIGEGTVLTYEITFTNTDGDNASANVVDTLTKGQGYNANSATVKIGDGAATAVEPAVTGDAVSGQTLTWDLTGLADNAQVTITFDVTITRDAGAEVDNTATVNGHKTNTTTTPYPSDDKKDVTFADEPEISIDGKLVGVGDELTYVIDWAADKDGEVTVTDKIPAGTKLAEGEDAISDDGVEKDGTITWNLGKKSEGDKGTVTFMVVVTDDAVNHDPITNQATIQIGENDPKTTNEVTTDFPKKEVAAEEGDEDGLQVGDTLTYTIEYRNDKDTAATITVTDVLPDGLTYVDGSASVPEGAAFKAEGQTLTWTIENAAAGAEGTVTFQAVVNENATVVKDPVTNKATITVGEDEYTTNTTGGDDDVYTGDLTITKEIALTEGQGTEIDVDKEFTFTVTLKGTNDEPLTGTYKYTVGEGEAKDLAFGENGQATLTLKHGESAVIADLPEGASYSVAEADYTADGYTTKTPDNAEGTIITDGVKVDFINTYKPGGVIIGGEDTEAGIQVQKTFTGREWKAEDSFEFTIKNTEKPESVEDAPMPAETKVTINGEGAADGVNTAAFGEMSFDTVGEYVYEITETNGGETIKGITYDGHTAVVTVKVTDAGNGKLTAEVTYDNSKAAEADQKVDNAAAFTNTYDAASTGDKVPAGFTLTKEFPGHEWTEDYAFEFIMSPVSGTLADGTEATEIPMPKADDNAGVTVGEDGNAHKTVSGPQEGKANFDFGNITYDKAGTYVYEVKEAKAGATENGVTYSGNTATITVTVTDKDTTGASTGQLAATATVVGGTFTNTYEAKADYNADGAGGLDITKQLNNRNMTADQFTFTIEATGDNAADAAKKLGIADGTTIEVKNAAGNAGEAVSVVGNPFENMTFDETDDGVTYTYTIKEEGKSGEGDYAGYTLDGTTYTVSITATDKGDGTMTVTTDVNGTKYTDERATAAFVNTYDAGDVTVGAEGDAQIVAHKTLKNDDIANYDGAFKFQVTSGDVVVAEGTNDGNGNITFGNITYTTENLAAAATADGSTEVGKANLDTTGEADVYTFNYSVSEVTTGLPGGVTYDDGNTNVTVTVTDDRHGKLDVKVSYADGASSVEFVNTYGEGTDGTAELNLKGNKEIVPGEGLTEAPALVDDTYTFEITGNAASDGTPAPMPTAVTTTNQNGAVAFGPITFTMENVFGTTPTTQDVTVEEEQTAEETTVEGETATAEGEAEAVAGEEAAVTEGETVTAGVANANEGIELQTAGRTKTFTYTIKETAGSMPGVTNDTSEKTITVTVTDEGDGKISVVATPDQGADEGNDFTFTNVYNVEPETSSPTGDGGFTITKTLTGRDMKAGEFEFRLEATDSDWWTAPTNPAAADGEAAQITFGDIQFNKPGDYTYTLKEKKGNVAGVDYDDTAYTVIAHVTDKDADGNYTGKLTVTWEILGATDKTVAFKNTYTADPTSVSLGAGKLIKGRDLKAGEFSFLLTDADGKEIDTAKNEENGAVTFKTITFDEAGTYSYEIKEVLPKDDDSKTDGIQSSNVTYDENIYHVTVDVKDNTEKGCLEATVTYEDSDGAPVFVNTYTEPKKETPAGGDGGGTILGVKTGDVAEILPLLIVMAAAIVVIIAMSVILIRRRRR